MRRHFGKCALCGKECELTFEHIPPRAAFNDKPVKGVSGEKFIGLNRNPWEIEDLQYINLQRGYGKYSLCQECNNNTGSWYGDEYLLMVRAAYSLLAMSKEKPVYGIIIKECHPLRLIKQVLSMFCSINPLPDKRMEPLRSFVLNKNATGLDPTKYKVCMYFTDSSLLKLNGLSVIGHISETGCNAMAISEITAFPLGFLLYFDPKNGWEYNGIDITSFGQAEYDDKTEVTIPFIKLEVNSWISGDFRTKDEIIQCITESNEWEKENGTETATN